MDVQCPGPARVVPRFVGSGHGKGLPLAPKAPRPKAEAGRSQIPAKGPEDAHGRVLSAVRTEWTQGESRRAGDENPELLLLCSNWPQQPAAAPRSEFSSEEGKTEIPNSRI